MTRKYVCDNCGKETDDKEEIKLLQYISVEPPFEAEEVADLCAECREKLDKCIGDGFQ